MSYTDDMVLNEEMPELPDFELSSVPEDPEFPWYDDLECPTFQRAPRRGLT